ncbi:MAG: hypothetical protein KKH37_09000 [Alphaproteobacteria bacterium]|nr:hypothetical protein [Alphaproteobacteria bacterium]
MKISMRIAGLMAAVVMVGGCSTMLANQGRSELVAQCASMGENMRFLPGETRRSDNPLFSSASVQGQCVGPDHSDYDEAIGPDD